MFFGSFFITIVIIAATCCLCGHTTPSPATATTPAAAAAGARFNGVLTPGGVFVSHRVNDGNNMKNANGRHRHIVGSNSTASSGERAASPSHPAAVAERKTWSADLLSNYHIPHRRTAMKQEVIEKKKEIKTMHNHPMNLHFFTVYSCDKSTDCTGDSCKLLPLHDTSTYEIIGELQNCLRFNRRKYDFTWSMAYYELGNGTIYWEYFEASVNCSGSPSSNGMNEPGKCYPEAGGYSYVQNYNPSATYIPAGPQTPHPPPPTPPTPKMDTPVSLQEVKRYMCNGTTCDLNNCTRVSFLPPPVQARGDCLFIPKDDPTIEHHGESVSLFDRNGYLHFNLFNSTNCTGEILKIRVWDDMGRCKEVSENTSTVFFYYPQEPSPNPPTTTTFVEDTSTPSSLPSSRDVPVGLHRVKRYKCNDTTCDVHNQSRCAETPILPPPVRVSGNFCMFMSEDDGHGESLAFFDDSGHLVVKIFNSTTCTGQLLKEEEVEDLGKCLQGLFPDSNASSILIYDPEAIIETILPPTTPPLQTVTPTHAPAHEKSSSSTTNNNSNNNNGNRSTHVGFIVLVAAVVVSIVVGSSVHFMKTKNTRRPGRHSQIVAVDSGDDNSGGVSGDTVVDVELGHEMECQKSGDHTP